MAFDRFGTVGARRAYAFCVSVPLVMVAAVGACDFGMPGQVSYRAALTVINRTTAEIIVESGGEVRFSVPACDEVTRENFPVNWWTVTSPGRDMFHSGGGISAAHSFLVVTSSVSQQEQRPDPLPPCEGLLQPGGGD
jgi:hypothetical protein